MVSLTSKYEYITKCGSEKGRNALHRSMHCCGCSQHNLPSKHLELLDLPARLPAIFLTSSPSISLTGARQFLFIFPRNSGAYLCQKSSRFFVTTVSSLSTPGASSIKSFTAEWARGSQLLLCHSSVLVPRPTKETRGRNLIQPR